MQRNRSDMVLYFGVAGAYHEPVTRLALLTLLLGFLAALQFAPGQVTVRNPRTPKSQVDETLPNGSSRTLAMVRDDQKKSLEDIASIKKAALELEEELSKSEFLVSLTALEKAEQIEELAKDIQGRLKRRR